jgi:hypothetical protein
LPRLSLRSKRSVSLSLGQSVRLRNRRYEVWRLASLVASLETLGLAVGSASGGGDSSFVPCSCLAANGAPLFFAGAAPNARVLVGL